MKSVLDVFTNTNRHWVGDGFPVRSLFSYNTQGAAISPFLLLDYAGPHQFAPTSTRRGVGQHPHRGFETVTIVYEGELEHRDSAGNGGVIGPGDVQWMTAAGGIIHEEFHSPRFGKEGGTFKVVQLWVNLPAKDKIAKGAYQALEAGSIPSVALSDNGGHVRVIAGNFNGTHGPARTFTPINVWDASLNAGAETTLNIPHGHTAMLVVLSGEISVNNNASATEAEVVHLSRSGSGVTVRAGGEGTAFLVLTGEPIAEPIAGYGPFVMNSEDEIHQAIDDFNNGRFIAAA